MIDPHYLLTCRVTYKNGVRKQARRTGMAGPLGEMFDHGMHNAIQQLQAIAELYYVGCDAINTTVCASRFS